MKNLFRLSGYVLIIVFLAFTFSHAQEVETIDGVRVVHNGKTSKWGKSPKVSIEFVKTIGDIESEDENILFYMPADIAFDTQGNVYVLDSGNHRIQKFSSDGKYVTTIGRRGQGPGEFQYPLSIDVDEEGYLYISDSGNQRIQVLKPSGADHKTIKMVEEGVGVVRISGPNHMIMGGGGLVFMGFGGMEEEKSLPKLLKVLNLEGDVEKDFVEQLDYKDNLVNRTGNRFHFTVDKNGNVYVAFDFQNRIEKYSSDGKLLWKSDRKLSYSTDPPKEKGSITGSGGRREVRMPQMNRCSNGLAVDDKGRIWVVTLKRQIREDERVQTSVRVTMDGGGNREMSLTPVGNTDVEETDVYQLEVYAPDGILLGKLPLNHFVDDIRIAKDKVFLLDKLRGARFSIYNIVE